MWVAEAALLLGTALYAALVWRRERSRRVVRRRLAETAELPGLLRAMLAERGASSTQLTGRAF